MSTSFICSTREPNGTLVQSFSASHQHLQNSLNLVQNSAVIPENPAVIRLRGGAMVPSLHLLWQTGSTLRIKFLNGDPLLIEKIFNIAKIWTNFANLNLERVTSGPAEIRVLIDASNVSWSCVGNNALSITDQNVHTIVFGWLNPGTSERELQRVVLHEFGHALGLGHEHQNPAASIQWNREAAYQFFRNSLICPHGRQWRDDQEYRSYIDDNVLNIPVTDQTVTTFFDRDSIMCYHIPRGLAANNFETSDNYTLSRVDKAFIARLYPGRKYMRFNLQTATCLPVTNYSYKFLLADHRDIVVISERNEGQNRTEIHILTAASRYQQRRLHVMPRLQTDGTFDFLLAKNGDIMALKKRRCGSQKTELHVLSAAHNYQQFVYQMPTCLDQVADDSVEFLLADNGDIIAIKKRDCGTQRTELHVLSAAHNYQQFAYRTPTCLPEIGDASKFLLASNGNIFAIKKRNCNSGMTEIHVLSAAHHYQQFVFQVPTCLGETDEAFDFLLLPDQDLMGIMKSNCQSQTIEVHSISAS